MTTKSSLLIIRKYGKNTDFFIDRFFEIRVIEALEPYDITRNILTKLENGLIEQYLEDNNLTAEEYDLGLYIIKNPEGNGNRPNSTSNVLIKYRGYLPNGAEFDESWNTAANFNLTGTIEGWRKGIPQFREGGRGTILMASYLGYGENSIGIIPSNSVLIFDIDLIAVY